MLREEQASFHGKRGSSDHILTLLDISLFQGRSKAFFNEGGGGGGGGAGEGCIIASSLLRSRRLGVVGTRKNGRARTPATQAISRVLSGTSLVGGLGSR